MSFAEETKNNLLAALSTACEKGDVEAVIGCIQQAADNQPKDIDPNNGGYDYVAELVQAAKSEQGYSPTLLAATEKWLTNGEVNPSAALTRFPEDIRSELPGPRALCVQASRISTAPNLGGGRG